MVTAAYIGCIAAFFAIVAQFYIPGKGFSYLIAFGGNQETERLSKIRKLDYYIQRASGGYDAQYYVQIAMDPSLQNQALKRAIDSLPYRARRILFPAIAFVLGAGEPGAILQAYALLNAYCWVVLAVLLLYWFPPRDWDRFLRWIGVLASLGVCLSLRNALIDGPSLLVIAIALYLLEKGWTKWSTVVLGLAGLGKETNLLSAASLLPSLKAGRRAWISSIVRGVLVALPLVLWLRYLAMRLGPAMDPGSRNFDFPFAAYLHKWHQVLIDLPEVGWPNFGPFSALLMLVSLTVQFGFMVLRPNWEKAWWRVGLSFSVLMIFLGDAVWEGYPGAAARVLLPMQLAFNVLVPVGRGWRIVLLAGNLSLLASPFELQPPAIDGYVLGGNSSLFSVVGGKSVNLQFGKGWYGTEGSRSFFWSWARSDATQQIRNPHPFVLRTRWRFSIFTAGRRSVHLKINGEEVWGVTFGENQLVTATLSAIYLQPGENRIEWITDAPPVRVESDPRELAFVIQNLHLDVLREKGPDALPAGNADDSRSR